jgi:hypothetical protein
MIRKVLLLLFAVMVVGCGGKSSPTPTEPTPKATAVETGNPYYPMRSGTAQVFTVNTMSAAHWDAATHEVVTDTLDPLPNPHGAYLILRYDVGTCAVFGDKVFHFAEWNFQQTTTPNSGAIVRQRMLGDVETTASNGIPYIGEQIEGTSTTQSVPEPLITMQPVAGEEMHERSTVGRSCDEPAGILEANFLLDYYTVRHWESWRGYADVWQTSLVENHPSGMVVYYTYFFSRNVGLIGFTCWTAQPNHYSCGNEYLPN